MIEKSTRENSNRESVWDYPRPPAIENVPQRIKILFNGEVIADSINAKRVLETSHPPTYYIPMEDIKREALQSAPRRTWCEWKGQAEYFDVVIRDRVARSAGWYYPKPTSEYLEIKDHVAFYANKMDKCYVGDELVKPQKGDFYGGWITSNIDGPFKGGRGTSGW